MRDRLIGLAILIASVALCWAVVAAGQGWAGAWIARATSDAPVVETLFALVIYAPLIVAGVIGAAFERRNAMALGTRPGAGLLVGLATGAAGLSVAVGFAALAGVLGTGGVTAPAVATLVWGAAVVLLQVVAEEVYFRGWLQPALMRRWGRGAGTVAGALAFAALHVAGGARAPISLLNLFGGGLMFGLFAARSGGIAASVGAHWAWNASEQLLWGIDPNPGLGAFGAIWDRELVGRAIWGGSADGLNGSLGMAVALVAILVPLLALSRRPSTAGGAVLRSSDLPDSGRFRRVPF